MTLWTHRVYNAMLIHSIELATATVKASSANLRGAYVNGQPAEQYTWLCAQRLLGRILMTARPHLLRLAYQNL